MDERGAPTQSALTFPEAPYALAAAGGAHVLAACGEGVHVYELRGGGGGWVQALPWPGGVRAAPGQQLAAAANPRGSVVLLAGYRKVRLPHQAPRSVLLYAERRVLFCSRAPCRGIRAATPFYNSCMSASSSSECAKVPCAVELRCVGTYL